MHDVLNCTSIRTGNNTRKCQVDLILTHTVCSLAAGFRVEELSGWHTPNIPPYPIRSKSCFNVCWKSLCIYLEWRALYVSSIVTSSVEHWGPVWTFKRHQNQQQKRLRRPPVFQPELAWRCALLLNINFYNVRKTRIIQNHTCKRLCE